MLPQNISLAWCHTSEVPEKRNLTLSVNDMLMWYLETASSFVVWHESVTISLHQFQTLFLIYPIRRVIHLDNHLLPKSTITIFTLTGPSQRHFTWISILSVALCLGSKLCCGSTYSQLLAVHTAATSYPCRLPFQVSRLTALNRFLEVLLVKILEIYS